MLANRRVILSVFNLYWLVAVSQDFLRVARPVVAGAFDITSVRFQVRVLGDPFQRFSIEVMAVSVIRRGDLKYGKERSMSNNNLLVELGVFQSLLAIFRYQEILIFVRDFGRDSLEIRGAKRENVSILRSVSSGALSDQRLSLGNRTLNSLPSLQPIIPSPRGWDKL